MYKLIISIIFIITTTQIAWTQGEATRQLEVEVNAPAHPVGSINNLSEAGFAGLYYQAGTVVDGWLGYVGDSVWQDTSTFQIGSSSKPIHVFAQNQRAISIDTTVIAISKTLHVDAAEDVLFGDSMTDAGIKFLWLPERAALRAGEVFGTQWDIANVGQNSTAFGSNCSAFNNDAMVFGSNNKASGIQSLCFGFRTRATANQTTAFGSKTMATKNGATAWGEETHASAFDATVWGKDNVSSGSHSTSWGEGNKAQSIYETVIGSYADTIAGANASSSVATDHLLVVGNGTSDAARSNALTVYKNGNTRVAGALNVDMTPQFVVFNNTQLNVGSTGYLRLQSTASVISPFKITLSDGSQVGQILFISCRAGAVRLFDGPSNNTNLVQTRTLGPDDSIKLLWDGDDWLELSFSNN